MSRLHVSIHGGYHTTKDVRVSTHRLPGYNSEHTQTTLHTLAHFRGMRHMYMHIHVHVTHSHTPTTYMYTYTQEGYAANNVWDGRRERERERERERGERERERERDDGLTEVINMSRVHSVG